MSRSTKADPDHAYNAAALRLQLLVAMAAVDERVQMSEIDVLVESIPAGPLSELDQQRLRGLLRMLMEAPPRLEDIIEHIVVHSPRRAVSEQLAKELVYLASVDGHVDDREEELLRLVCGALRIRPLTMRRHLSRERPLTPREQARLDGLLRDAAAALARPAA
jgi:hypothetical protein